MRNIGNKLKGLSTKLVEKLKTCGTKILFILTNLIIELFIILERNRRYKKFFWLLFAAYITIGIKWLKDFIYVDRSALICILTVQIAFALYLIAVKKEENFYRILQEIQEVFEFVEGEAAIVDQVRIYANQALAYSQRKTVYILAFTLVLCPFVLVKQEIVYKLIVLLSVWNIFGLLLSFLFHRLEILKAPIGVAKSYVEKLVTKIQESFGKEGLGFFIILLIIFFIFKNKTILPSDTLSPEKKAASS